MIFTGIFLAFLGLVFGSFLSALSYRYPKGISIVKGRSFCPHCGKKIHWFDNIPLLSFVLLKGRCRSCKKRISWRYPLVELATAAGFVGIYFATTFQGGSFKGWIELVFPLFIFLLLELIFIVDFEHQIIPDDFVFFGIFLVFIYYLLILNSSLFSSLFAGFLSASILMLIHLASHGRGMGLGDVKFAVFGGMITGLNLFLVWLFLSFLTGGVAGIILILGRRAGLKDKIAFGPFLVIGLVLALVWGEKILRSLSLSY